MTYAREKAKRKAREEKAVKVEVPKSALAVVADCHIGNFKADGGDVVDGLNERCRLTLDVFRRAIQQAKEAGAACLAVAGDLFHVRRPEPAVIAAVQRILQEEAGELPVLLIPGNHDMLDASAVGGNTAMAPLYREATLINEPTWVGPPGLALGLLCVPFSAERPMREYLAGRVLLNADLTEQGPRTGRVLITHVGVYDDTDNDWCRSASDGIHADELLKLMRASGFKLAVVGNFHHHRSWGDEDCKIVQVGTLCPGNHSDNGVWPEVGGMLVYEPTAPTLKLHEVPGPRFVAAGPVPTLPEGTRLFVQEEKATPAAERADLPQAQDAMGAIEEYAKAMRLPDGIEASQVLEAARGYWERA